MKKFFAYVILLLTFFSFISKTSFAKTFYKKNINYTKKYIDIDTDESPCEEQCEFIYKICLSGCIYEDEGYNRNKCEIECMTEAGICFLECEI